MKTTHILVLISTSLLLGGCNKEKSDLRLPDFDIPVIEGYYLRDINGANMGIVGSPNTKQSYGKPQTFRDEAPYIFHFYPNPVSTMCEIYVKTPSALDIKKIWITQACYGNQLPNSSTDIPINIISVGGAPLFHTETQYSMITIDLSSFQNGYYRIYVKTDDVTLYDNLVIYKQ